MSKTKERSSAAIFGLLDAIKSEGIEPVNKVKEESNFSSTSEKHFLKQGIIDDYKIVELDTSIVKPWHMANRIQQYISKESCSELIESIRNVGQQIPALVRYNTRSNIYELICGARRLFVCKLLSIKLKAAVVKFTDKEALLAMDAENRPREDISSYERALDYKNWIDVGIYKNQAEIYKSIGMKKSLFTQVYSLASLNSVIVKAFGHPNNLTIKWGYKLARECKNKDNEALIVKKASELLESKSLLSPSQVYKCLIDSLKDIKNQQILSKSFQDKKGGMNLEFNSLNKTIKIKTSDSQLSTNIMNELICKYNLKELKKV